MATPPGPPPPPPNNQLQAMLQSAVQSVQWTYSLFWQLCPQQGILVWGDGYYNGAIKTRKTVQPMEVSTEEASLQRSEQLRELYHSLSAGETNQPARRPSAALSPEDLTESEWFYLMCVSFSFPPGVGLPGKSYAKRQHVWLTGANEVDSKVFLRAILAKSARVQTVVCIPLLDGVVELGTTEKVQENIEFIKRVKSFFIDHHPTVTPKPALSGHSTSNPALSPAMPVLYTAVEPPAAANNAYQIDEEAQEEDEEEDDEEDDDEEADHEEDEQAGQGSDSEAETGRNSRLSGIQNPQAATDQNVTAAAHTAAAAAEPSELMQLDMSEDIRLGSPDDGSNNLDSNFHMLAVGQTGNNLAESYRDESALRWPDLQLPDPLPLTNRSSDLQLLTSGAPILEELTQEDTHYSHTVSTILNHQSSRWSDTASVGYSMYSSQSSFSVWTPNHHSIVSAADAASQWVLKYILFTVPFLHSNPKARDGAVDSASRFRKGTPQDELSANHVLAERRRREKLNERFIILRSLVPVVTKMDKASILGDTIEYVKQLRKKVQDLEARARQMEIDQRPKGVVEPQKATSSGSRASARVAEKRKMRIVEGSGGGKPRAVEPPPGEAVQVEVSIIESEGLVELQCSHREGLLLDVMQKLRELRVEITTVQSSLNSGVCAAEMRAKVKENVNGKRVSIAEVKRAINQIIPPH